MMNMLELTRSLTCCRGKHTARKFGAWQSKLHGLLQSRRTTLNWAGSVVHTGGAGVDRRRSWLHTWGGTAAKLQALQMGFKIIDSHHDAWYLDCGAGIWLGWVGKSWCAPWKSWQMAYLYDPEEGVPASLASGIQGGEVALWGEQNGESNYEVRLWSRALVRLLKDPCC